MGVNSVRKIEDVNSTEIGKRRRYKQSEHELISKAKKVPWQSREFPAADQSRNINRNELKTTYDRSPRVATKIVCNKYVLDHHKKKRQATTTERRERRIEHQTKIITTTTSKQRSNDDRKKRTKNRTSNQNNHHNNIKTTKHRRHGVGYFLKKINTKWIRNGDIITSISTNATGYVIVHNIDS